MAAALGLLAWSAFGQTGTPAAPRLPGEKPRATPAGKMSEAKEVVDLLNTFAGPDDRAFLTAYSALDNKLAGPSPANTKFARQLLTRRGDFVTDPRAVSLLDAAAKKKAVSAAQLLLQIARAQRTVRGETRGHVVIGQVIVEEHKTAVEHVLAQMPILIGGYFAGEVADLTRPISFRAQGYQGVDVRLEGKEGDVISLGEVRMKPLPKAEQATLRGTVQMDIEGSPTTAKVKIHLQIGPVNTLHNGYTPRKHSPPPVTAAVKKNGEFAADGLSPGDYEVQLSADKHVDVTRRVSLKSGAPLDLGACRLFSTDIGKYVGKPAPNSQALAWESNFAAAAQRAQREKKPLMIMMTATWCGYCKLLEDQTLSDPWVRHFLSDFVVVKAYEDKQVEAKYGPRGYPTLVFTDSEGKPAYMSIGFKPTLAFCAECALAIDALKLAMPPELQVLIDKKVIELKPSAVANAAP